MSIVAVLQWLQQYSVVFMFVAFLLILAGTFWPGRKSQFERDGQIPFQDER